MKKLNKTFPFPLDTFSNLHERQKYITNSSDQHVKPSHFPLSQHVFYFIVVACYAISLNNLLEFLCFLGQVLSLKNWSSRILLSCFDHSNLPVDICVVMDSLIDFLSYASVSSAGFLVAWQKRTLSTTWTSMFGSNPTSLGCSFIFSLFVISW